MREGVTGEKVGGGGREGLSREKVGGAAEREG